MEAVGSRWIYEKWKCINNWIIKCYLSPSDCFSSERDESRVVIVVSLLMLSLPAGRSLQMCTVLRID